jgi:hypothetical protein
MVMTILHARLVLRLVQVYRDAAAVVDDPDAAVLEHRDQNRVAVAGECLIDRVVDHLVDEVVETARTGGTDVHSRTFSHRLETLEHLDLICSVAVFRFGIRAVLCHVKLGSCQVDRLFVRGSGSLTRNCHDDVAILPNPRTPWSRIGDLGT